MKKFEVAGLEPSTSISPINVCAIRSRNRTKVLLYPVNSADQFVTKTSRLYLREATKMGQNAKINKLSRFQLFSFGQVFESDEIFSP